MWRLTVSICGGSCEVYLPRGRSAAVRVMLQELAAVHDRSVSWAARLLTCRVLDVDRVSELDGVLARAAARRGCPPQEIVRGAILAELDSREKGEQRP